MYTRTLRWKYPEPQTQLRFQTLTTLKQGFFVLMISLIAVNRGTEASGSSILCFGKIACRNLETLHSLKNASSNLLQLRGQGREEGLEPLQASEAVVLRELGPQGLNGLRM